MTSAQRLAKNVTRSLAEMARITSRKMVQPATQQSVREVLAVLSRVVSRGSSPGLIWTHKGAGVYYTRAAGALCGLPARQRRIQHKQTLTDRRIEVFTACPGDPTQAMVPQLVPQHGSTTWFHNMVPQHGSTTCILPIWTRPMTCKCRSGTKIVIRGVSAKRRRIATMSGTATNRLAV
jgi:hypothetical protein